MSDPTSKQLKADIDALRGLRAGYIQQIAQGSADGYWDHLKATVAMLDRVIARLEIAGTKHT